MKVLLVRPTLNKNTTTVKNFLFGEPIGLECVVTILKELGHDTEVLDLLVDKKSKFEKTLKEYNPDIVGFTAQCTDVDSILKMSEEVKKYNDKIITLVGGVQATGAPESFFNPNMDYIFKTTTRENYKQLLEQIENNVDEEIDGICSRKRNFESSKPACQNEYIKPDRECTKKYRKYYRYVGYAPCAILQTSFGCRNHCEFCVRWRMEGPRVTELPVKDVVDEIESLDEDYIMIVDNDFLINEQRLIEFMDLLEERNIKKTYMCNGSVNSILEKEYLFERLSKNGLKAIIVGYESFNDEQLVKWNKQATVDDNYKATQILKKNGIATWGSFILLPDFSKQDFKNLVAYHKRLKPELQTFSPLVPHPLTPLYNQYKDRLIYPKEDYEKWNFGDVLIYPSKMSLKEYYWEVLKFGIPINLNWWSIKYMLTAFPIKNTLKMIFGFDLVIKIYLRNMFSKKDRN